MAFIAFADKFELFNAFVNGTGILIARDVLMVINTITREDGSNKSYILKGYNKINNEEVEFYVKTK